MNCMVSGSQAKSGIVVKSAWPATLNNSRLEILDHYANMSVQYTAIFHGCKNDKFQMIFLYIFLIFAQNIDCGYTLEPPQ